MIAEKAVICVKNIPVFATEWGVASLIFKEIPYKQIAYVRVQDVQPGHILELCEECAQFCRAAGAETVVASGHEELEAYPFYASVLTMQLSGTEPKPGEACLFPVTDQTVTRWRQIYNEKMRSVDYAETMTTHDEKEILSSGGAYFVHGDGKLLGIGWMEGEELRAIASVVSGMGETVARTLFTLTDSDTVRLQVASTNDRAIRLYERMGFIRTGEKDRGFRIV